MAGKLHTQITTNGRECTKCNLWRPWEEFNKASSGFKGCRSRCRYCDRAASAKWKDETNYYEVNRGWILDYKKASYCPRKKKSYDFHRKDGITLEQWVTLYNHQGGKCSICRILLRKVSDKTTKSKRTTAVVGHNHTTGTVRRLLCHNCNRALGLFGDDPNLLKRASASAYVEATNPI